MALRDIALARHCSRVLQPRNEKIQEIELSMRTVKRPLFFLILPCLFALEARAQKFEIDPYAGALASGRVAHLFKVSPEGIYGVRRYDRRHFVDSGKNRRS